MLKKQLSLGVVLLGFVVCLASCEKEVVCELPVSPCQENCELVPMMGWCGTGAAYKYYFNKATRQCEPYIYVGDVIPFETLQECEDCLCTRLIPEGEDL